MEGIGSEVSQKIRAAIKAKLIELGAYVDEELPDYIMVMVANKRTKTQMDEDLQLFLSSNTKLFTTWLHTVLNKLQEVTVAGFGENENKKSKRKHSESSEAISKRSVSEESKTEKKKHKKPKKDGKKPKKNKHRCKEKEKVKKKGKQKKAESLEVTAEVGKAIMGAIKERDAAVSKAEENHRKAADNGLPNNPNGSNVKGRNPSPPHEQEDKQVHLNEAASVELGKTSVVSSGSIISLDKETADNEFNIEPLKEGDSSEHNKKTVLVPTMELLKEHDKLLSQQEKHKSNSDSSVSPEELRRQLLLGRDKKMLEKLQQAAKSSPEVVLLDGGQSEKSLPREAEPERVKETEKLVIAQVEQVDQEKPSKGHKSPVILRPQQFPSSSESSDSSVQHAKVANKSSKAVSSRIVSLPEPEGPEIPSIVKVKPREFISKEKQANKHLILKAVAAAEKSIACVQPSHSTASQPRKAKALFTKDLRGNRREKIAITLANDRLVTKKKQKENSLTASNSDADSEIKKAQNEDQFISSKPTNQGNDKYIECWLEGVNKAVQHSEILNPSDMEQEASEEQQDDQEPVKDSKDVQIVVTLDGFLPGVNAKVKPKSIGERFGRLNKAAVEPAEVKDAKPTLPSAGASKNKQLIAQLSEKFGKVDREFENKRKRFELDDLEQQEAAMRYRGRKEPLVQSRYGKEQRTLKRPIREDFEGSNRSNLKEKCTFWPHCSKGDKCEFVHPNTICELLPDCKYKDKCVNIHPVCKKDLDCTYRHCSYKHTSERSKNSRPKQESHSSRGRIDLNATVLCKFNPNCLNLDCRFYHPSKRRERESRVSEPPRRRKWSSRS